MATNKTARKAANAALAASLKAVGFVAINAGRSTGMSDEAIKAAIGKAKAWTADKDGKMQPTPRAKETQGEFMAGYIGGYMAARHGLNGDDTTLLAYGHNVLKLKGATSKGDGGKRTVDQERAYNAARQFWFSAARRLGLKPADNRGAGSTGNKVKAGQGAAATNDNPKSVEVPAAVAAKFIPPLKADKEKACAYVQTAATSLVAYCEDMTQRLMKTRKETMPLAVAEACVAFRDAVNKALAK